MKCTASIGISPVERLEKILIENKNKFHLSKDGTVSLDFSKKDTISAIRSQIERLKTIDIK